MATQIHPTAIVSPKAHIDDNVSIGAYAIVEDDVHVGAGTQLMYHTVLLNGSRVGKESIVFPGAVIGAEPQDLRFHGQTTYAVVGDRTTIRECATVNRGSHTKQTTVGDDCLIMAYSHIAHDCTIGNHVVIANATQLGGHVEIGDWVVLGGVTKVHQFCRVGKHAMVAADAMLTKDVSPYALLGRTPVKVEGINKIGILRRGFTREQVDTIDSFYNTVFFSGYNMTDGINAYATANQTPNDIINEIVEFIKISKRGVYR
ncbi:MAG: acyl-ACP--UDP-N-acetylglucosamine O-acyltransferase [Candidatus Kapaibacterium sp.]|nr:acyl-ACP--UDP-N-acetylglucosamine O-acyltransferase [Bacteroidota bacterium]